MVNDFNPFEDLGLTEHIKETYSLVFPMNKTEVTVIRRPQLAEGNFGSEQPSQTKILYTVTMNINPVQAKPYNVSKEGISKLYSFEVFTNPSLYPTSGKDSSDNKVDTPMEQVLPTDIIEYQGHTYSLAESFEDVSLNDQPLLWQHFFMRLIN